MPVVSAQKLGMSFADRVLFEDASFALEKHDKTGLVGANGCGKTTLLRLISGELEPTSGNVVLQRDTDIGFLRQHACTDENKTAYEEILTVFEKLEQTERELERLHAEVERTAGSDAKLLLRQSELTEKFTEGGGLTFRSRARSMLLGLGFTEEECSLKVGSLSGGQRTKISLGKLLLSDADMILLDEPTNHLDIDGIRWLEDCINKFNGAALIVSHDRYFLDRVTNRTMEIEHRVIRVHKGNYSVFAALKREREKSELNLYRKQESEVKRIEGIIAQQKQFNREKNYITIASRTKELERIKAQMHKPEADIQPVDLRFECARESGNDVLNVRGVEKAYGDRVLFSDVSFRLFKGDRVFILGPNGCGKTTLMKIIESRLRPDRGLVLTGANVIPGCFDQIQGKLDSASTILADLHDSFPTLTVSYLRGALGSFGFSGDDKDKLLRELSGGERARLELLRLMLKKPNFLLLDEPTNHLDADSREALEQALADYSGTLLCVSHDRYFINKLASRLMIIRDGRAEFFDGGYDEYVETLADRGAGTDASASPDAGKPRKVNDYKLRKERESQIRKLRTAMSRVEEKIALLDEERESLESALNSEETSGDYEELIRIGKRLEEIGGESEALYAEWSELDELLCKYTV